MGLFRVANPVFDAAHLDWIQEWREGEGIQRYAP